MTKRLSIQIFALKSDFNETEHKLAMRMRKWKFL